MQSKDEIELAVLKAFREVLIEVLSFGFGFAVLVLAPLLVVLLIEGFFLSHSVIYGVHNKHSINKKKINVLSLSSNQRRLGYGDRNNIFGRFPNGTVENIFKIAWSSFGIFGGFFVHEIMS